MLLLCVGLDLVVTGMTGEASTMIFVWGTLGLFAALSIVQPVLRRQKLPVWTQKAKTLAGSAFLLTIALSFLTAMLPRGELLLPVIPLLQPLMVGIAWALFLPLDRFLKTRMMDQARAIRLRNPDLVVIGITGSVGKTTTKELLACALKDLEPLVTPAHVNTELGVAQWLIRELPTYIARRAGKPGILVVEMGAYRKGEIALMSSYVRQTIGVITHIGTQHLALFGSQEALRDAKAEIITQLPKDGHAFLNGDNELCRGIAPLAPCPVTIVGTGGKADLEAFDVEETTQGIRFTVDGAAYDVPVHGTHNVTNVLLTIAIARHLGVTQAAMQRHLRSFSAPDKTFTVRESGGVKVLDDTHNSSAASFKAAIAWAKTQPYERKTLLASGLIELGDEQERTERELGELASPVFGEVVFLDARSARIFAQGYGKPVHIYPEGTTCAPGTLLVCVGRMPASVVRRFLPAA